ncbi:MAG: elongation factor 4 [Candidatus Magasanikbacteria bacterium]|jgi:GTP-binding protein LepA|nr:elongation factor 4 [Candidatus Magasanikbacteria bacterium]MBT4314979.1 elongation factor 4 [Candidatus Magasanikbacteria bacterium]MBT4546935.1 elongation factor 4 [Candidatus Magasanikbacteria bacterium]MBT6819557.1 elongation factor 4 [Candidatus Magasanikbacteria bacterium]
MNIRNFCIIAHIDHGKSTLADRLLELTGTIEKRNMKAQLLDQMDIEQERGITIKLQPVRMAYKDYVLNLIDTPGHVDFTYEVSRSLAAVEGAILLVDSTQGVQAQTIGNLYLALEQDLKIIPVLNKIDLPNADVEKVSDEIIHLIGCKKEDILTCSAKTGEGVEEVLKKVIAEVPEPKERMSGSPRGLIFDSFYDDYKGVVASIRMIDGELSKGDGVKFMGTGKTAEVLDLGSYTPKMASSPKLENGQVGYVVTGLKELGDVRVGDTITLEKNSATEQLPGYKEVKPMVFAGIFPQEGDDYNAMRDAVDKLKLNDSALYYEPEHSQALGFGFRCGFLGMLHLEIFQERLRREFGLHIIATVPSVAYHIFLTKGEDIIVKSPQELPDVQRIDHIEEPWMTVDIITPKDFVGNVMGLVSDRKGIYTNTEYLSAGSENRAMLHYEMPLASLITDFYDKLKTVTSGYGSLNYEFKDYRKSDVVKMDILIAEDSVEALSSLVWQDEAFKIGKKIVKSLKDTLPKQQFVIKIQAAIGGKVIAGERLSALRKDVTAGLYGGDITRKRKLLEKQKKGKKKMMAMGKGKVDIPTEAYLAVLKR